MLNKAILMGRLTRDPEMRTTQNGTAVCSFSIAVDRNFRNQNGERQTDFINCVAWRQQAEFVSKYFTKGRMIAVVGSIQTRTYTDRDGNNRNAVEVVVDEVSFTGEPRSQDGSQGGGSAYQSFQPQSQPRSGGGANYANAPQNQSPAPRYSSGDFADLGADEDDDLPF